jgi:hypothetical protein
MAVALLASVAALVPGAWGFGLSSVTYPASIDRMGPPAEVRLPSDAEMLVVWGGDRFR